MSWGVSDMMALITFGSVRLKDDCDMPDLSAISLWNDPVAKTLSALRIWRCGGTGLDRRELRLS